MGFILDNSSIELEVYPEFIEKQEIGTHGFTLSYSFVSIDYGFI